MKDNVSDNVMAGLSKRERILKTVLESEIEQNTTIIALKSNVCKSTTRVYLRELLRAGKIVSPFRGSYCSKITHGMIFVPLRVHNVLWTSIVPWLNFSADVVEWTGSVKVRVQFGLQRKKITARISCDAGMDKNACMFALNRSFDIIKEKSGREIDDVLLRTFEVNRDVYGVRLDGAKCLTKTGLFGMVERIYQKDEQVVRVEHKISEPMSPNQFEALIMGGVTGYNVQQAVFALVQENKRMSEAIKFNNEQIFHLTKAIEKLIESKKK